MRKLEQWIWILNTDEEEVIRLLKDMGFGEIKSISMLESVCQGMSEEEKRDYDQDLKADLETQSRVSATIIVRSEEVYKDLYIKWLHTLYDNFVMYTDEAEFEWTYGKEVNSGY